MRVYIGLFFSFLLLMSAVIGTTSKTAQAATDQPDSSASLQFQCSTANVSLTSTDYLNIDDGQITPDAQSALDDTFKAWASQPNDKPLTIAIHFHGGLIDHDCGLYYDDPLKPLYSAQGAVPYFFIYNVGGPESIFKGDAQRGLFGLYDNRAPGLLNDISFATRLTRQRDAQHRGHDEMTRREDWLRDGIAPLAILGRTGLLAWAYMKQSVVDGLDLTNAQILAQPPPAESCNWPSADELNPWPHLRPGKYKVKDAGARTFLCKLQGLIEHRSGSTNIVLIGHSTGAIYATDFIRKAQRLWTTGKSQNQKFDLIFLAPAVTYETFYDMIAEAGDRVQNFREFTMTDYAEQHDYLIYQLLGTPLRPLAQYYDRSLLYLVSGDFEPTGDLPLVGMMRFQDQLETLRSDPANARDVWLIDHVNLWLGQFGGPKVVFTQSPSVGNAKLPFAACETHHGDFGVSTAVAMESVMNLVGDTASGKLWPRVPQAGAPVITCEHSSDVPLMLQSSAAGVPFRNNP